MPKKNIYFKFDMLILCILLNKDRYGYEITHAIKELSALPNRDGMLSMLLSCLQSPVSSFARAIKAVADAKEAGNEPTAPAAE